MDQTQNRSDGPSQLNDSVDRFEHDIGYRDGQFVKADILLVGR